MSGRWQLPKPDRLRSAYDAQDRNTRNLVIDLAVDEEVLQAEDERNAIMRHIACHLAKAVPP